MTDERINWNDAMTYLFWMVRNFETMPTVALTIKLQEEVGEFSEVMLHEMGYLRHKDKEWKDTPVEEAADIINVLIGALVTHYPDKTPGEISDELYAAVKKKGNKYAELIGASKNLPVG